MKSIHPPLQPISQLKPFRKAPPKGAASPFPAGPRPHDVQAMFPGCGDHDLEVCPVPRQALALILPPAPPPTRRGGDGDMRGEGGGHTRRRHDVINTFCLIADEIIPGCGWAFAPSTPSAAFGGDSGNLGSSGIIISHLTHEMAFLHLIELSCSCQPWLTT